jgi:hypothetical protein
LHPLAALAVRLRVDKAIFLNDTAAYQKVLSAALEVRRAYLPTEEKNSSGSRGLQWKVRKVVWQLSQPIRLECKASAATA